jgi:hypothetical protein
MVAAVKAANPERRQRRARYSHCLAGAKIPKETRLDD